MARTKPTGQAPRLAPLSFPAVRGTARQHGALAALLLLVLFNALFTARFLTVTSMRVNLTQVATITIVAVGMTFVIATGGIDLSVGSLMAISGAIAPKIFLSDRFPFDAPVLGVALAIVVPVLAAGLGGSFNGVMVAWFRIQPIIATLVLFLAGRGIAQVITGGALVSFREPSFQYLGMGRPLGIPFQVILMVVIVAIAAWVLRSTIFGRYVLATGDNEPAAWLAGVPVRRVKLVVYTVSGLLAGLAGLISIAINSSSDANQDGQLMELDAIAAVAVGGTPLTGGQASIVGTLIGALIIQLLRYTLLSHGVSDAAARVVTAVAIVLAVLLQRRER
ncbi:MAG TPA: ABC transporter permease [Thermomicrobiales bacterium]|nr:ABC transporter permease [Thermomicrobiales bacterium]